MNLAQELALADGAWLPFHGAVRYNYVDFSGTAPLKASLGPLGVGKLRYQWLRV